MNEKYYVSKRGSNRPLKTYSNISKATKPKMLDNGSQLKLSPVYYVLIIFLCVGLIATLVSSIRGFNTQISFTYFLEYLSSSPSIDYVQLSDYSIVGNWGVFDIFRQFFSIFYKIIGVGVWVCQLIFNCFAWIWWAFKFFFV